MIIKERKNRKNVAAWLVGIVCLTGLIYSVFNMVLWKSDSEKTNQQIDAISELVDSEDIDFSKLKDINSDTKGWVQVRGTSINYPFVQSADNIYYLSHSFDKSYNQAGWIFLDYRNNINNLSQNTIIYAHGRVDGTMFGTLKDVLNSDWYSKVDNHIIKLSTEKEKTAWQVFSVYHIKTTDDYLRTSFSNDSDYQSFLDLITNRGVHDFDVDLSTDDKVLTLSTCYSETEKIVLHAKLVP